jgi:hypothetical protein
MTLPFHRAVLVLFLFGALASCQNRSADMNSELATASREFKSDLVKAVSESKQITIIEHSWMYDFRDSEGDMIENAPMREYLRLELSDGQKADFLRLFEQMPVDPKTAFSLCAFQPHHSIEIMNPHGERSVISVCFSCDDTAWDGSKGTAPQNFQSIFRSFIEPLGFQASRQWSRLAEESNKPNNPQMATPRKPSD